MNRIKYMTLNCSKLDDDEFEEMVGDVEHFIKLQGGIFQLPQNDSEKWLHTFVESYAKWPGRQFKKNRFPMHDYFGIGKRTPDVITEKLNMTHA